MIPSEIDNAHIWHPYNALPSKYPNLVVKKTEGVTITLEDGRELIDGMSSWWSAIWGYNHPKITQALIDQAHAMPHIMFGGLTHSPAVKLTENLLKILPKGLESIFYCDSGSVSVEVALKTAIQYQKAKGLNRDKFIAFERSYHGDTLGAMSVCDPTNSMHSIYNEYLPKHFFAPAPRLEETYEDIEALESLIKAKEKTIAGIIIEPILQGAGGMRLYRCFFLKVLRTLADKYKLVLIFDEIATGFGHTGKMFGCDHAGVVPDIMTVGKGLTGGFMTMAAMITTKEISDTISKEGVLMHGPTFMANPLSCAVANASIELLLSEPWKEKVATLSSVYHEHLFNAKALSIVKDVRTIGVIGVIELHSDAYAKEMQDFCVDHGVWIRPFGTLIYTIVAYTMPPEKLVYIIDTMIKGLREIEKKVTKILH